MILWIFGDLSLHLIGQYANHLNVELISISISMYIEYVGDPLEALRALWSWWHEMLLGPSPPRRWGSG